MFKYLIKKRLACDLYWKKISFKKCYSLDNIFKDFYLKNQLPN